jgi:asparagine N-glycosylation enzyme membrane subunit Stt3
MTPHADHHVGTAIWRVLVGVGVCLVVAGAVDLGLGLYPLGFGSPEWEFGGIGNFLNRLPLLGLGLTLALAGSLARGRVIASLTAATLLLVLAVVVVVFGILFVTNLPLVLRSFAPGAAQVGAYKAMAKTGVQTVVYSIAFMSAAVYAIRVARRYRYAARRRG